MLLEQPRLAQSSSGQMIWMNRDGETREREADTERCLILLIASGDFLFHVPRKNRHGSAVCNQGRWHSLKYLQKAKGHMWDISIENTTQVGFSGLKWDGNLPKYVWNSPLKIGLSSDRCSHSFSLHKIVKHTTYVPQSLHHLFMAYMLRREWR